MSGDGPVTPEIPNAGVESGASPVVPEAPQLSPAEAGLIQELSVPAVPPVEIIRDVAADTTVHQDAAEAPVVESDDGKGVAQPDVTVEGGADAVQQTEIPLTEMSDQQLADRFDTYLPGLNASSGDRGERKIARNIQRFTELSQLPNLDIKTAAERDRLRASLVGIDSRLSAAVAPAEETVAHAAAVSSVSEDKTASTPEDPALEIMRESVAKIPEPDFVSHADNRVIENATSQFKTNLNNADKLNYALYGQDYRDATNDSSVDESYYATENDLQNRKTYEPVVTDEELDDELTSLIDTSGKDPDHPYGQRIREINNFIKVRDSKKTMINGIPKEEAVQQMRDELTKGVVGVPRPEQSDEEQPLGSIEDKVEMNGTGKDPALTTVLGKLDAFDLGGADTVGDTSKPAASVETAPVNTQEDKWINGLRQENMDYLATPPRDPDNMPWERNQKIRRFLDLREKGPQNIYEEAEMNDLASQLAPEQPALKGEEVGDLVVDGSSNGNAAETPDLEAQAIAERRAALINRVQEAQDTLQPKDDSEEMDPFTAAKWNALNGKRLILNEDRKYLAQPFVFEDKPAADGATVDGETSATDDAKPEGSDGPSPEDAAEAARIAELKSENMQKLQEALDRLRPADDSTVLDGLDRAKIEELSRILKLWEGTTDPIRIQDWAKNYAYEANSILQADSIEEVDAISSSLSFSNGLDIEALKLNDLIARDPSNTAAADRLAKIDNFNSLSPDSQVHADAIDALRKELLIRFDFDSESEETDDEPFALRWKRTPDDDSASEEPVTAEVAPQTGGRFSRLRDKAKKFFKSRGGERATGATGSAIPPESAAAVPDLTPARVASRAIPPTAPTGAAPPRNLGSRVPINENTVTYSPGTVPGEPAPVSAAPDRAPATGPAASPDTARVAGRAPEPAPAQLTGEQKLAAIFAIPGRKLTTDQALEASQLIVAKDKAISYDRKGAARSPQEEREFKALNVEFATAIEADRAARETAIEPLYSDEQQELKKLRDLRDSGELLNEVEPIKRLNDLEAAEARYQELSAKDKLSSKEQEELVEMGDTWKDPVVKAKEKEILDLADTSLESSSDFAKFAERLQEYALSKHGRFHPALEIGVRMAVEDYFNRKDSGMTLPEKEAMGKIQKLLKGMQQEITTIMTYKQNIEHQFEQQKALKEQIEVSNKLIEGEIGNDDVAKQEAASKHIKLLADMASTNASIRVTHRRAEDANFNFARKNREVKKELGLDGIKDMRLGVYDDLRTIYKFATRNFGLETQPILSIDNPNVKR